MDQLVFERFALGHIAAIEDDAVYVRVFEEIGGDGLEVATNAIRQLEAPLHGTVRAAGHEAVQESAGAGHLVWRQQIQQRRTDQAQRITAQNLGDRRTGIAQGAIALDDGDHVRRMLDQSSEARLGPRVRQLTFEATDLARDTRHGFCGEHKDQRDQNSQGRRAKHARVSAPTGRSLSDPVRGMTGGRERIRTSDPRYVKAIL
jgi:hypothetical protein